MAIRKARLMVIKGDNQGLSVEVHFNPQSLKVNHRTSGPAGTLARGKIEEEGAAAQQTGYNASLAIELLFDTTTTGEDVRNTTLKLVEMIQPSSPTDAKKSGPPAPIVQFQWGTFLFSGNIQSMDETLDFFSDHGVPLRATVGLSMNSVSLNRDIPGSTGSDLGFPASVGGGFGIGVGFSAGISLNAGIAVGTIPLTLTQSGESLQSLTGRVGVNTPWQAIATANNIDNPRLISPGTTLNLNVGSNNR